MQPAEWLDQTQRAGMVNPVQLLPAQEADERTSIIMKLVPEPLRGEAVKSADFADIKSNEALLKEITRAVPLKLLLDHSQSGLPAVECKSKLTTSHFFLSTPVTQLSAFVSHRWSTDANLTVTALIMHLWFAGGTGSCSPPPIIPFTLTILSFAAFLIVVYPPLVFPFVPFVNFIFLGILTATANSETVLRLLGYGAPRFWYDKATVHQTAHSLTQAGVSLFGHFLEKSEQLVILFQPEYLTRVWVREISVKCLRPARLRSCLACSAISYTRSPLPSRGTLTWCVSVFAPPQCVYELAYWLSHERGERSISLVPLNTYNALCRSVNNGLTSALTFVLILLVPGVLTIGVFALPHATILWDTQPDFSWLQPVPCVAVLIGAVPIVFCVGYCFAQVVVGPARKERQKVAEQLRNFDVRSTRAFNPSDKEFVLGEICRWWPAADREKSLDAFNEYVHTKVGPHLTKLQRRRERTIYYVVVSIAGAFYAYVVIFVLMLFDYLKPLAWSTFTKDLYDWLMPASCASAANIVSCASDVGVSHLEYYTSVLCINGTVTPPLSDDGCAGPYESQSLLLWLAIVGSFAVGMLTTCMLSLSCARRSSLGGHRPQGRRGTQELTTMTTGTQHV